jgi:formylmethanofuran dehydrogenase subunit E
MSSTNWSDYEKEVIFTFYKKKCCECKERQKIDDIYIKNNKMYCKDCHDEDSDSD